MKRKPKASPEPTSFSFETFKPVSAWVRRGLEQDEPSCFNGYVEVEKYRITVEKIDEPVNAVHDRLKKMWVECDNYHHYDPLQAVAKRFGLELENESFGKQRKVKR